MKILIVTQYFYPENFKSNDMAFELQKRGHKVTVLTGIPNYPSGNFFNGYGFFRNTRQTINGVHIIRSWLLPRGTGSGFRLFLNYFSWAFFASIRAFFLAKSDTFDAIIVHEPSPITQFYPAWVVKRIQKNPIYFWVLDLWPESLQTAGGINNKVVLLVFRKMVQTFYNASDKILISSKGFRTSILEKGNFENKLHYFPNWGEDTIANGSMEYKIPSLPNGFKVMFAGNVGEAQDMGAIMDAALLLKKQSEIKFIIVGNGRRLEATREFINKHNLTETVWLMGRFPIEAMATFFNMADVMLVSLKDDQIFNITVPAKVQAYMSATKPIVAMLNGEGGEIIKDAKCGVTVNAGNAAQLAAELQKLASLPKEELDKMGKNGKQYYLNNFTLQKCIDNLEEIIYQR